MRLDEVFINDKTAAILGLLNSKSTIYAHLRICVQGSMSQLKTVDRRRERWQWEGVWARMEKADSEAGKGGV